MNRRFLLQLLVPTMAIALLAVVAIRLFVDSGDHRNSERIVLEGSPEATPAVDGNFHLSLGSTGVRQSSQSSFSFGGGEADMVQLDRITIQAATGDAFASDVAAALAHKLQATGRFHAVTYAPFASETQNPERLAGATLLISTDLDETSGRLSGRTDRVELSLQGGRLPTGSRNTYSSTWGPPLADWNVSISYNQERRFNGIALGRNDDLIADEAATEIASKLLGHLDQIEDDYAALPPLPAGFYPAYQQPPEMGFLDAFGARQTSAGNGFLTPTVAGWSFISAEPVRTIFDRVETEMTLSGWATLTREEGENKIEMLRLSKDQAMLEVYPDASTITGLQAPAKKAGEPQDFLVSFRQHSSRDEQRGILIDYLSHPAPQPEVILALIDRLEPDEKQQALDLIDLERLETGKQVKRYATRLFTIDPARVESDMPALYLRSLLGGYRQSFSDFVRDVKQDQKLEVEPPSNFLSAESLAAAGIHTAFPINRKLPEGERFTFWNPADPETLHWVSIEPQPDAVEIRNGKFGLRPDGTPGSSSSRTSRYPIEQDRVTSLYSLGDGSSQMETVLSREADGTWTVNVSN